MKEIFTLNLGFNGNFSSSYFWQIQDMCLKPAEYHQPFFIQTREGYFPRMLGVDYKESISFPVQISDQEAEVLWGGKIQKIDQDVGEEEKWTDLLSGMVSRKNILPVYRDFPVQEELEDQIRYFAESADMLQGVHSYLDNDFSALFIKSLEILSDFYPKAPNLVFSFNFKYSAEERRNLCKLWDYGNNLLIPCTEVDKKIGLAEVALAVDVMSFTYREKFDINTYLQKFFRYSQGNTCELALNERNFSDAGVVFCDQVFTREGEDVPTLPEGFLASPSAQYLAKVFQSSNIENFYGKWSKSRGHEDDEETTNAVQGLLELFSELDFMD